MLQSEKTWTLLHCQANSEITGNPMTGKKNYYFFNNNNLKNDCVESTSSLWETHSILYPTGKASGFRSTPRSNTGLFTDCATGGDLQNIIADVFSSFGGTYLVNEHVQRGVDGAPLAAGHWDKSEPHPNIEPFAVACPWQNLGPNSLFLLNRLGGVFSATFTRPS